MAGVYGHCGRYQLVVLLFSFGMAVFCNFLTVKEMRYFSQWLFFDEMFPYLGLE